MRTYPAIRVTPRGATTDAADLVAAALDGLGALAIQEEDAGSVVAYVSDDARERAREAVLAMLPDATIELLDVPDEDWAARSQAALTSIQAGALTVAPPWDAPDVSHPATIVINPAMGFGTGHHATTRLCLLALQKEEIDGADVIDVGTGSGVLAIAAARLGAARVVAVDNDQDAIDNAVENVARNGVDLDLRCISIDELRGLEGRFDVVVANLTGAALVRFAVHLQRLARENGRLVLSGILSEEADAVVEAFGASALVERTAEGEWVCFRLRRTT